MFKVSNQLDQLVNSKEIIKNAPKDVLQPNTTETESPH